MSLESVRAFLAEYAPELDIIELDQPTATVAEAAAAHGAHPAQIAKTISLRLGEQVVLVVAAGTARLDNRKTKEVFGHKPRMLDRAEVESLTGHPVGGVCPFGLPDPLPVYCDVSLRAFETVIPAAGAINSAVRLSPDRLAELTQAVWVDICQART